MVVWEKEPLGSCHLDLDAWVKGSKCRDIVFGSRKDIVIQSSEQSYCVYQPHKKLVFDNVDLSGYLNVAQAMHSVDAYNCGIVRINSQKLKDQWLETYWKITRELDRKQPAGLHDKYTIPDLISEQWVIFQLCRQNGYRVECICDGFYDDKKARDIGYTHLISEQKYEVDDELRKILRKLTNRDSFSTASADQWRW